MNGVEIYNFTLETVPVVFNSLLLKANLSINNIDYFVFHQANKFMLEALRKIRYYIRNFIIILKILKYSIFNNTYCIGGIN